MPFFIWMFPVALEMVVTPGLDCDAALAFKKPAIFESSLLTLAPEYFTLLRSKTTVPLSAFMISAEFTAFTGPLARRSTLSVPFPLSLSREVTPYAFAILRMAGNWALGARMTASTVGVVDW